MASATLNVPPMGFPLRSLAFLLLAPAICFAAPEGLPVPPAPQPPPKVVPEILARATPDNVKVAVSLSRQRVVLLVDGEMAIDSPASTGGARGPTPPGEYKVSEKKDAFSSDAYGDFVAPSGFPLRAGASTRIDSAPSGTVFRAVPVTSFMRLAPGELAIYAGRLPGYPASDRAVRLPADIAAMIFARVKPGTPVRIEE